MKKNEKASILIVDDKVANIIALEALLADDDRHFLNAQSGEEGLKIALDRRVDLIILDVQMPNMDGFEVAQILKSNKKTKDIPIIFASAEKKDHSYMMKGFGEGAVDYLFKPLDPEITKAKVSVLLQLQLQKKELIEKNALLEKSALLINNSADIIGIVDAISLKIEQMNPAFTVIAGFEPEEIHGTSLYFFLDAQHREMVQSIRESGGEKLSFESRIYCKDRSVKWLHWNVVVKNHKWFVNARDITAVKQVEQIRNYLAAVVKQSHDSIYIHDEDGQIISWNQGAERIYGFTESEALQMRIWNIIPEYLQPDTEHLIQSILNGEKIEFLETRRITKHGKIMDVLFSAALISGEESDKRSIVITERDVTEQKIADEKIRQLNASLQKNVVQLEAANNELEAFSYSISHDLRAPLRALNGNARALEEDLGEKLSEDAQDRLRRIRNGVTRMDTLITDLLAFSRVGKKEVRKTTVNVEEMVKNIVEETRQSFVGNAQVTVSPMPDAYGDYALLQQVWVNLVSNALKYSSKKENPEIKIGANAGDGYTEYFVKDNGVGFDMAYSAKLFGTFQRLHDSTEFEGTGIGLAIVQRIIHRHGGTIRAESVRDQGATFYFTIPDKPSESAISIATSLS